MPRHLHLPPSSRYLHSAYPVPEHRPATTYAFGQGHTLLEFTRQLEPKCNLPRSQNLRSPFSSPVPPLPRHGTSSIITKPGILLGATGSMISGSHGELTTSTTAAVLHTSRPSSGSVTDPSPKPATLLPILTTNHDYRYRLEQPTWPLRY